MTAGRPFELGLFTFGEITPDPATGRPLDPAVRLREFVDLASVLLAATAHFYPAPLRGPIGRQRAEPEIP